jgi:RNA methyltransferase, TrmH family
LPGLSRAEEKLVQGLVRRRRRADERLFVAEGVRVTEELLAAGVVPRFAAVSPSLEDTERGRRLRERLARATEPRAVTDGELGRLAQTRSPQGVLVVAEIPGTGLEAVRPGETARALVLDAVQDPGNIGTLARSAAAFGCALVVCLPGTVDPWNAKSVRASAGALFRLPIVEAGPAELWAWLERHDFRVLGADAGGEPLGDLAGAARAALVVGNEGAGLSDEVRTRCHRLVAVPMAGDTESLNVAVAAGILLYDLTRGRQ